MNNFYSPNNGSEKLQKKIYTKKSHKHAAGCWHTFRIVNAQEVGLLHVTNRQKIFKNNKHTYAKEW